jgi:hypothetical protein
MSASGTDNDVMSPVSAEEGDDEYWKQCEDNAEGGVWAKVGTCGAQEVKMRAVRKQIVAAVNSDEEAEPISV